MRQWLADALRRIASRIDPPPPDWCDLVVALKREHEESVESARLKREIQVRWEDVGSVQRGNVIRLRK